MTFGEVLHKLGGHVLAILALIVVIAAFGAAYLTVIKPAMAEKPVIAKPALPDNAMQLAEQGEPFINPDHINFLANEIGAYRLQEGAFGFNDPVIVYELTDTGKFFSTFVEGHIPNTYEGVAPAADIKIKTDQRTAALLLSSNDVKQSVKAQLQAGNIQVELISDMKTLAAKGFLGIYEIIK